METSLRMPRIESIARLCEEQIVNKHSVKINIVGLATYSLYPSIRFYWRINHFGDFYWVC